MHADCDEGSRQVRKCEKPQPPLLLRQVLQYTSNFYVAVLPLPLSPWEVEMFSIPLPFVSWLGSNLDHNKLSICTAMLLGKILVVWVTEILPNKAAVLSDSCCLSSYEFGMACVSQITSIFAKEEKSVT